MLPVLGGLTEIGGKLLDKLIPDPKAKAEAQLKLFELQQKGELTELEQRYAAIIAEAQSGDKWTSRARPTFMYVFYVVILSLVIVAPLIGVFFPAQMKAFFENVRLGFEAIPGELWATFTAGYLGYGAYRTFEKVKKVMK